MLHHSFSLAKDEFHVEHIYTNDEERTEEEVEEKNTIFARIDTFFLRCLHRLDRFASIDIWLLMAFILLVGALLFHQSLSIPLLIDLTHTIQPNIPFFPSQTRFNFTNRVATWVNGEAPYFYATNTFITGEHMGTHLDAPYHFSTTGWKADEIPLEHLTSIRARIIDVSKQCQKNKNYLITIDDVRRSDLVVPQVHEETGERFLFVLLFYTGWSKYWPDQKTYAGDESHLEFPGLSEQLANYLIETYGTNLVGVGIDTLSREQHSSLSLVVNSLAPFQLITVNRRTSPFIRSWRSITSMDWRTSRRWTESAVTWRKTSSLSMSFRWKSAMGLVRHAVCSPISIWHAGTPVIGSVYLCLFFCSFSLRWLSKWSMT